MRPSSVAFMFLWIDSASGWLHVDRLARRLGLLRQRDAEAVRDPLRELLVDVAQIADHARRHLIEQPDLRQLEHERRGDMRLLVVASASGQNSRAWL